MNTFILIFCLLPLSIHGVTDLIVSNHPICTKMGEFYLQQHSVTAPELAIIVSTCEGIVNPHYSGLGGGFIATVFNGYCGESRMVNAREISPASYTYPSASQYSEIGIPSMLKGLRTLYELNLCGKKPVLRWKDLFTKNIELARNGWDVIPSNLKFIHKLSGIQGHTIEITNDERRMRNPVLAQTLENIANGVNPLEYLESQMMDDLREAGSLIQPRDIQNHRTDVQRFDTNIKFRNYTILASTLPGSGFTFILGAKIVDAAWDNLQRMSHDDRTLFMYHTLRYMYSVKPYLRNPRISQDQILANAHVIAGDILRDLGKSWDHSTIQTFGNYHINFNPVRHKRESGTANIVIRRAKYAITMTSTINSYYGSKYFSRRLGFPYNDQLKDFDEQGSPNAPGPLKIPQSAISAIILYSAKGNPVFQIGAAGGSKMIGAIFNTFFNYFVSNMSLNAANDAPRCTPQYRDMQEYAICEEGVSNNIIYMLQSSGIDVSVSNDGFGGVTVGSTVHNHPEAAYDVRRGGKVLIVSRNATVSQRSRTQGNSQRQHPSISRVQVNPSPFITQTTHQRSQPSSTVQSGQRSVNSGVPSIQDNPQRISSYAHVNPSPSITQTTHSPVVDQRSQPSSTSQTILRSVNKAGSNIQGNAQTSRTQVNLSPSITQPTHISVTNQGSQPSSLLKSGHKSVNSGAPNIQGDPQRTFSYHPVNPLPSITQTTNIPVVDHRSQPSSTLQSNQGIVYSRMQSIPQRTFSYSHFITSPSITQTMHIPSVHSTLQSGQRSVNNAVPNIQGNPQSISTYQSSILPPTNSFSKPLCENSRVVPTVAPTTKQLCYQYYTCINGSCSYYGAHSC